MSLPRQLKKQKSSDRDKLEIFIEKAYDITCHFMSFLANQSDCLIQEVLPFQSSLQEELRKRTPRLLLSTTKRIITTTSKISFNLKDIINLGNKYYTNF
ncbi:hypothetical protein HZS_6713 [Henneguya salminicola]|nr:hypothetical protein HZS_6713 [Henneguya salminicola]